MQLLSTVLLSGILAVLNVVGSLALASQGRVAVSTGDFGFLFTTWQGWLLVLLALVALYAYVGFDLNANIALSARIVRGEPAHLLKCLAEGGAAMRAFVCPEGALVVLYIALVSPLLRAGLSIPLTDNLKIPAFISSVIKSTPLYNVAYILLMILLALVGLLNFFCVHGVVIDGLSVGEARRRSRELMRKHWRQYLLQTLLFVVCTTLVLVLAIVVVGLLTLLVATCLQAATQEGLARQATIFVCAESLCCMFAMSLVTGPLTLVRMTQLYLSYTADEPVEVAVRNRCALPLSVGFVVVSVGVSLLLAVSASSDELFGQVFPVQVNVGVIAHRGGGNEGPENTVAGLRAAAKLGIWGSEIDIQRTADGAYVVNHDNTFKRTTGDKRKPSELTLDEVRTLSVDGEPVATYEDMLAAAHEAGIHLIVELKGPSADHQMADDAVRIAREMGVLDECVFISLKYELIDYLESTYPEAYTGFLAFASYGNMAALNCDYLGLEELPATDEEIADIHEYGKGVLVWTPNDMSAQQHFLLSDVDAIITDKVSQAEQLKEELESRGDVDRIVDALFDMV